MAFARRKPSKPRFITNLATSPSRNSPTNSAEEAKKTVDDNYKFADLAVGNSPRSYDGFFDLEFSAVGDTLTLLVDGKPLLQTHDSSLLMGTVNVAALGDGLFTDVDLLIPTKESLVADRRWPPGVPPLAAAPLDDTKAREHQAAWAKYLDVPVVQTNSIGMKLVLVPPSVFQMGATPAEIARALADGKDNNEAQYLDRVPSEAPQHRAKITKPFYLGMYQVTQGEYEKVMGANPSSFAEKQMDVARFSPPLRQDVIAQRLDDRKAAAGKDTSRCPVETVDWDEAAEFCRRLSALPAERAARRVYRLPTEAEWEDACRAGTTTGWSCGDDEAGLAEYAWFGENSGGMTHPVGEKKPNAWGLYDMHGNVYQWCWDGYDKDHYAKSRIVDDPARPPGLLLRVDRGGSWHNPAGRCRSAARGAAAPEFRNHALGLRVYLDLPDVPGERAQISLATDAAQPPALSAANQPPRPADGKWDLPPGAPAPAVAPFDETKAKEHQAAWAKYLDVPVVQTNSVGMKLVLIPPGEFTMGSPKALIEEELRLRAGDGWYGLHLPGEGPQHRVRITKPYWLGATDVTQEEYQRAMGSNPSKFQGGAKRPVEQVSWDEAMEFCRKLSEVPAEKAEKRRYGLPSEAQWEHACRAGTTTRWYFGDDKAGFADVAWFLSNAGGQTHPVGQKRANAWGLYDMCGNVWQWCLDWYDMDYYAMSTTDDPAGPPGGLRRVRRGGGYIYGAERCRSAARLSLAPGERAENVGFRVLMVQAAAPADEKKAK
jgi:formylglycine-generating enzyme required for sulfatase activity